MTNLKKKLEFEKKIEMKKKWLETTQKIEPLHAKPQNSSKERGSGQYTGKSLLMLHIPHTMVNAKCAYGIYGNFNLIILAISNLLIETI